MTSVWLELLKVLGALVGAVIGAFGAVYFKEYQEHRRRRAREQQTRWLPLLRSAQDLKQKLDRFVGIYLDRNPKKNLWVPYGWTYHNEERPLPLEARDFHEIYLLDMSVEPIEDFRELNTIPGDRRRTEEAVRNIRARIHELNGATVLLYSTAVYLGYSRRVRMEMTYGQLHIPSDKQQEIQCLLVNVRSQLNGPGGAGMVDDLQDLVGESVWNDDNVVISYYEFRERILKADGWELYTELFRFFCHFHKKIDDEVERTRDALAALCDTLGSARAPSMVTRLKSRLPAVRFQRTRTG